MYFDKEKATEKKRAEIKEGKTDSRRKNSLTLRRFEPLDLAEETEEGHRLALREHRLADKTPPEDLLRLALVFSREVHRRKHPFDHLQELALHGRAHERELLSQGGRVLFRSNRVEDDRDRVAQVERRVRVARRDRDGEVAQGELLVHEAVALAPEEERDVRLRVRFCDALRELCREDGRTRQVIVVADLPRRADDEVELAENAAIRDACGLEHVVRPLRAVLRLDIVLIALRVDEDELGRAEILHRARDGAQVAWVLDAEEDDGEVNHGNGGCSSVFMCWDEEREEKDTKRTQGERNKRDTGRITRSTRA